MGKTKYFSTFLCVGILSMALNSSLYAATLDEIKQSKTIKIGVRINQPPFSVLEDGNFRGFEVDLAKAIAKKIAGSDVKIEFIGVNAKERIPYLQDEIADMMVANFTITAERAQKVDFSTPYLSNNQAVVSKKEAKITNINQLREHKTLIIPNTTSDEFQKNNPDLRINMIPCDNAKDCYEKLKNGEADSYLHTNILNATLPLIDPTLETSVPIVGCYDFIAVAVKKGNKELLDAVNSAIMELSNESFFQRAYKETLEPFYRGKLDKRYLLLDSVYNMLEF